MRRAGMAAALLLAPGAALAEPVYFHKPDVEREAFEAGLGASRTPAWRTPAVIASEAKQSSAASDARWIASSLRSSQ